MKLLRQKSVFIVVLYLSFMKHPVKIPENQYFRFVSWVNTSPP